MTFVQLTPEEADRYRECPVYLDFHSGFYVFPVSSCTGQVWNRAEHS